MVLHALKNLFVSDRPMTTSFENVVESIISGKQLDSKTVLQLASQVDPEEFFKGADRLRLHFRGTSFHLCSIINARSGNCSEDCRFCAQSGRYQTNTDTYELVETDKALEMARENDSYDVSRLSLVTSGRTISDTQLNKMADIYGLVKQETSLKFCASMGLLNREKAERLVDSGVSRYHCNLEACKSFFPQVCTTHTWEEKVETLQHAKEAGMTLCSGGIIGMGETMEDRIAMALELRELDIKSIPINILTPIAHTPFADIAPLPVEEVLTTIACFRYLNPDTDIRLAGGRQLLGDEQYRCFSSGANGAIVGDYLTTVGSKIADDLKVLTRMGYTF